MLIFVLQKQPLEKFYKQVFIKILQSTQDNIGVGVSFLTKLQEWDRQVS